jgi:hypothetical protein
MTSRGHKLLIVIYDSNVTQRGLRILEILVAHRQVGMKKMCKNYVKSSKMTGGEGITTYKGV